MVYNNYYIGLTSIITLKAGENDGNIDTCILIMQSDRLQSDALQCTYTENSSILKWASLIVEAISCDSSIYMCILHASNSFDPVELICLFN